MKGDDDLVSTYFKNLAANILWRTEAEAALPDAYYLALSSTEPCADGTGVTEPASASGYTRVELTGLSGAVDGVTTNTSTISWPKLTDAAGIANYWVLFDSLTGGNLLMGEAIQNPIHLDANSTISIEPNALELHALEYVMPDGD